MVAVDGYSTFVNMFLALDAFWDEYNDEALSGFLSEASPYTFEGKGSADPAIWSEFSDAFLSCFPSGRASLADAYEFVKDYLEEISDEYRRAFSGEKRLVDAFAEIAPLERWIEAFELQEAEK